MRPRRRVANVQSALSCVTSARVCQQSTHPLTRNDVVNHGAANDGTHQHADDDDHGVSVPGGHQRVQVGQTRFIRTGMPVNDRPLMSAVNKRAVVRRPIAHIHNLVIATVEYECRLSARLNNCHAAFHENSRTSTLIVSC
jgi:hypothetical protein